MLPEITVPRVDPTWDAASDPFAWPWAQATTLPAFTLADGSRLAQQQTTTQLCYHAAALFVRFHCVDRDIWGTYTQRDEAIYDEEVVEIFLAAGQSTPVDYYELEISPNGVLLDVLAHNPTGDRASMTLDFAWDCPGLRAAVQREDAAQQWQAILAIPWASVGVAGVLPKQWRANFYRIERPRGGEPEFSCWSPTMTTPADFHRPAYFGHLVLEE